MIVVLLSILPVAFTKYLGFGEELVKLSGFLIIAFGPVGILIWVHRHYKAADGKSRLLKYESAIKWWSGDVFPYVAMLAIFFFSYGYTIFGYTFDDVESNDLLGILIKPNKGGVVGMPYIVALIRLFCGGLALYEKEKTNNLVNSSETTVKENNLVKKSKRKRK